LLGRSGGIARRLTYSTRGAGPTFGGRSAASRRRIGGWGVLVVRIDGIGIVANTKKGNGGGWHGAFPDHTRMVGDLVARVRLNGGEKGSAEYRKEGEGVNERGLSGHFFSC